MNPRLAKVFCLFLILLMSFSAKSQDQKHWFERFKDKASDKELYRFLYALPKGGDLHNHLTGSALPAWWYDAALQEKTRGYQYYTKVRINNCRPYGGNEFGLAPYLLMFRNISKHEWQKLNACERQEFVALEDLDAKQKAGWLASISLDQPHEGRNEFFQTHWQRLNALLENPYLRAEILYQNMKAFAAEGLSYLETQSGALGFKKADNADFSGDEVVAIYKTRLQERDARATKMEVRLQYALLRFAPNVESDIKTAYNFVGRHPDLYVGINLVGREDDDTGHPLRFLQTFRQLRQKLNIPLSIHGGEVDEPNFHVRDTLLLGARRIGHGLNLITDPEMMLLMRNNKYLVEINLISNLLLNYVSDYTKHPFPEYLRTDIPVALSTDDRGMWLSNMTDEFFVAVKEFNLSWDEILYLSRNSLQHGFMQEAVKQAQLRNFESRIRRFEKSFTKRGMRSLQNTDVVSSEFICRYYKICP